MLSYSDKAAIWFHKPTALNQPLFQMPLVGYVTGSQGALFFGAGLPAFLTRRTCRACARRFLRAERPT